MSNQHKVIPSIKVQDIIPFTREEYLKMSRQDKIDRGILLYNGRLNDYRFSHSIGLGGSYQEESWNKKKHWHDCCKSKAAWRHKTGCKARRENQDNDDLSDLKDIV